MFWLSNAGRKHAWGVCPCMRIRAMLTGQLDLRHTGDQEEDGVTPAEKEFILVGKKTGVCDLTRA